MFLYRIYLYNQTVGDVPLELSQLYTTVEKAYNALPNTCALSIGNMVEANLPTLQEVQATVRKKGKCQFYGKHFYRDNRHASIVKVRIY